MDGVARAAGSGVPYELNGETIIIAPLGLKQFGMVEQAMLAERPDPIDVLARIKAKVQLSNEVEEKLVETAYRDAKAGNKVSHDELMEYLTTVDGLSLACWLAFSKHQPDKFTREQVIDIISNMTPTQQQDLLNKLFQASGTDERGNATGPEASGAETKTAQDKS